MSTSPDPMPLPPPVRREPRPVAPRSENPVVAWARAIALGVKDTANDMLEEGRRGARDAYDEYWDRFEQKTRHRRKPRGD